MSDTNVTIPQDIPSDNSFEENKNKGWVKLYRSTIDSYMRGDIHCLGIWFYLLILVDRADKFSGGQQVRFKGEYRGSIAFIAEGVGLSRRTVRRVLDKLSAAHSITFEAHNKGCIIRITNWGSYQNSSTEEVNQTPTKVTSNSHQLAHPAPTIQELKKLRRKEIKKGGGVAPELPPPIKDIWLSYSQAYEKSYEVPMMNPSRKQIEKLTTIYELAGDHAAGVVAFYCRQQNPFYIAKRHILDFCVDDLPKIYTAYMQQRPVPF